MVTTNRVVVLLTPVFSAAAAAGSAWLLEHFPGLPAPSNAELVAVATTVATAAAGAALKWLHGYQKYEATLRTVEGDAKQLFSAAATGVLDLDKPSFEAFVTTLVKNEIEKIKPVAQLVSDAEEFAHQPPATAADSPRPATAVKPDPVPAAAPSQGA